MSSKIILICDRCGDPCNSGRRHITYKRFGMERAVDLCIDCRDAFDKFMAEGKKKEKNTAEIERHVDRVKVLIEEINRQEEATNGSN